MIRGLGPILLREGLLTPAQHLQAIEASEETGLPMVSTLIHLGLISEDRLVEMVRKLAMVPQVRRQAIQNVPATVISELPAQMAARFLVCPIMVDEASNLLVAMADPTDTHAADEIAYHTGRRVVRRIGTLSALRWAIQHYYRVDMDQPHPPWDAPAAEEVVLLTKVKYRPPAEEVTEAVLLTPAMRREEVPNAASGVIEQVAPPAPSAPPPSAPPPSAPPPTAPPPPEPAIVPVVEKTRHASSEPSHRAKTLPITKRRKRKGTLTGMPLRDLPGIDKGRERDRTAYQQQQETRPAEDAEPTEDAKVTQPRIQAEQVAKRRPSRDRGQNAALWSADGPRGGRGIRSEAFGEAALALKLAHHRDEVGRALSQYFAKYFANAAFLVMKKGILAGWEARGEKLSRDVVRRVLLPMDSPSAFREAIADRLPRYGSLSDAPTDEIFKATLGYDPGEALLVPVMIRDRTIGLLYGDQLREKLSESELNEIMNETEQAYERVIMGRRG